jgi:hypothetical protein
LSEDTEEFSLDHMQMHKEFCNIFEGKVEDFLSDQSIGIKEFYERYS